MRKILFYIWVALIFIISFYAVADARAGWGWWNSSWDWGGVWALIAWLFYAVYYIRRKKMIRKAKEDLENALKIDSSWDIEDLKRVVENIFMSYQKAWSEKNLLSVQNRMTKTYYEKAQQVMLKKLDWKENVIKDATITELTLLSVRDHPWRDGDMFAMEVSASMVDYTVSQRDNKFLYSTMSRRKNESQKSYIERATHQSSSFKEYYIFIRYNWQWLLSNIKQQFSLFWDIISLSSRKLEKILEKERKKDFMKDGDLA